MAFTYFFRDGEALEMAVNYVAPEFAGRRHPRVWDAGCAMGPEAYTLAILFARRLGRFAFRNLRIDATDLDESGQFESVIRRAVYSSCDLERIPSGVLEEFFEAAGEDGGHRVAGPIRSAVRFRRHDLLSFSEIDSGYGLVVCKNVLLHFECAQRVEVIRMFHRSLGTGGCLVTEHTQRLPAETAGWFEQVFPHGPVYRRLELKPRT